MSSRPVIGVTCDEVIVDSVKYWRVREEYSRSIVGSGGLAVCLPTSEGEGCVEELMRFLDGLMLSGGGDLDPRIYGMEPQAVIRNPSPKRDEWEISLVNAAIEAGKPLLAICRGVQVLNVALGGTLHQEISSLNTGIGHEGEGCSHFVDLAGPSRLRRIVGLDGLRVNSSHHQAIDQLGHDLVVVGRSRDGLIEAVEHRDRPFVIGVQWHPERSYEVDPASRSIFRAFIRECAKGFGCGRSKF